MQYLASLIQKLLCFFSVKLTNEDLNTEKKLRRDLPMYFLLLKVDKDVDTLNLIFILMKCTVFCWRQMTSRVNEGSTNCRVSSYQRINCGLSASEL